MGNLENIVVLFIFFAFAFRGREFISTPRAVHSKQSPTACNEVLDCHGLYAHTIQPVDGADLKRSPRLFGGMTWCGRCIKIVGLDKQRVSMCDARTAVAIVILSHR